MRFPAVGARARSEAKHGAVSGAVGERGRGGGLAGGRHQGAGRRGHGVGPVPSKSRTVRSGVRIQRSAVHDADEQSGNEREGVERGGEDRRGNGGNGGNGRCGREGGVKCRCGEERRGSRGRRRGRDAV